MTLDVFACERLSLSRWFVSAFAGFSTVRPVQVLGSVFLKTGSIPFFLIERQSSCHYVQKKEILWFRKNMLPNTPTRLYPMAV
jgi:hypothetical protein